MNPIYIEYGVHQGEDCYKIDLPWSEYKQETVILCLVKDGIPYARTLAKGIIAEHAEQMMKNEIASRN